MKRSRWFRLSLCFVAAGLLGFGIVSAFFAYRFTTPPRRAFGTQPEAFLSHYEDVRFNSADGISLSGWYVPSSDMRRAVVLLHGNGATRTQVLARARFFSQHGYAALLYDARGHGKSDGPLVSFGWFETRDLLAALAWLRAKGITEIGVLGISQGGATIALAVGQLGPIQWAVLESVYPTLTNAVDRRFRRVFGLPGWFAGALMVPLAERRLGINVAAISPCDAIAKLECPVLVMTGDADRHTLPTDAREVFDRAPAPKSWWLVPGAQHDDLYGFAKGEYEQRVLNFISIEQ